MLASLHLKWLLDTNVVSEVSYPVPDPTVDAWLLAHENESVLSGVSIGELEYGVEKMQQGAKKRFLQRWLDNLIVSFGDRIWAVDMPTWRQYGRLKRDLELLGRPQDDMDILIAATALTHGLTLVTRNTKHFQDTGCKLFNPWGT